MTARSRIARRSLVIVSAMPAASQSTLASRETFVKSMTAIVRGPGSRRQWRLSGAGRARRRAPPPAPVSTVRDESIAAAWHGLHVRGDAG